MADYIERQSFIDDIKTEIINLSMDGMKGTMMPHDELYGFIERIKEQPAANVREDVQGEWAHLGGDEWCCTVCGNVIHTEGSWEKPSKKFCDECGARMKL